MGKGIVDLQLLNGALCDNPYHLIPIALVQRAMRDLSSARAGKLIGGIDFVLPYIQLCMLRKGSDSARGYPAIP